MTDQLRTVTADDLAMMREWRNAPAVRQMMYTQHVITPEEHAAWWAGQSRRADCRHLIFATDQGDMGVVSFSEISPRHGTAVWAFYARPDAPKGTGRRMEAAALDYAFDVLGLRKLMCEVLSHNRRVIALHKAHGFRVEGLFRAQMVIADKPQDVIRLALFSDRWRGIRQANRQEV
jgi:UDP-4-amino-4,6-dideoxy-N-acetyl-beta-L-altrosamine N-acetyltransferase